PPPPPPPPPAPAPSFPPRRSSALLAAVKKAGFRATIDTSSSRVNGKIKAAQEAKVPYMLVVGGKDRDAGTVSVRHRTEGDRGAIPLNEFVETIVDERDHRAI
ncbi:MAG: His/Gly/Thr/Pro-type tRNA ligase C-terminal domain-containing protein, partial [Planctomycetota bacterium]